MTHPPYRFVALRWQRHYVIVPIASIVRVEARDDRVCVIADRPYPHHATFAAVCAQLERDGIVRVHRSHAVNVAAVREVRARAHGEFALTLREGSVVVSGRSYRDDVAAALGLAGGAPAAPTHGDGMQANTRVCASPSNVHAGALRTIAHSSG